MQIIFLPTNTTLLLCFILWWVLQLAATLICVHIPDRCFDIHATLYRARKWEQDGRIYETFFHIHAWKKYLPDMGAILLSRYSKTKLQSLGSKNLEKFLVEACRAELTHILPILQFWVFGLIASVNIAWFMFIYTVIANLPCILVQRYNRPRILHILQGRQKMEGYTVQYC